MASFKLRRLHILNSYIATLEKQNLFSCKDALSLTKVELQTLLGLNSDKAIKIQDVISKKCVSEPDTVYSLYMNQRKSSACGFFPLSLHTLDIVLQGGLPLGSITEIVGPPGVGKTQFCFMLCILATKSVSENGLDGQVIYIDTESAFCANRLRQMAQKRFPLLYRTENEVARFLQKIKVHKATSTNALKNIILSLEEDIIKNKVKLIIVDSIASLMRKEYGTACIESVMERNKVLLEQAAILKDVAQTYGLLVFLTNQITSHANECESVLPQNLQAEEEYGVYDFTDFEGFSGSPPPAEPSRKKPKLRQGVEADHVIPAMGTTWSHCVNTRLIAQFLDPCVRQLIIMKSPVAPNAAVRYTIQESGIVLTEDDIELVNVTDTGHQNILTKYNFLTPEITGTGMVFTSGGATDM